MKRKELSKLRVGDELYYVYNHASGYRCKRAVFLRSAGGDDCYIQVNGRTVIAWALYLFKREDEAKEYAAKCTKSLMDVFLHIPAKI